MEARQVRQVRTQNHAIYYYYCVGRLLGVATGWPASANTFLAYMHVGTFSLISGSCMTIIDQGGVAAGPRRGQETEIQSDGVCVP